MTLSHLGCFQYASGSTRKGSDWPPEPRALAHEAVRKGRCAGEPTVGSLLSSIAIAGVGVCGSPGGTHGVATTVVVAAGQGVAFMVACEAAWAHGAREGDGGGGSGVIPARRERPPRGRR
ncbi:hypothetical protein C8J57DRAFT_1227688 [Mycena rebaudengoi]|nr:hypothetical protein C8J57DRAFT_1227688 [Mycena rebaudengoi]